MTGKNSQYLVVKDWDQKFESAETRRQIRPSWYPQPATQIGDDVVTARLLERPNGYQLFVVLELFKRSIAACSSPRGAALDVNGVPLSIRTMRYRMNLYEITDEELEGCLESLVELELLEWQRVEKGKERQANYIRCPF